jgi:hypothetical protein
MELELIGSLQADEFAERAMQRLGWKWVELVIDRLFSHGVSLKAGCYVREADVLH